MSGPLLALEPAVHDALWRHLLPDRVTLEQAAFGFAAREITPDAEIFRCTEWYGVPDDGFASRSALHFELTDETRGHVIKRAHDLGASLVEFHSHTGRWPAEFSGSDIAGFQEFVPHVWWRLKGRPYLALVITRSGFDGFAWLESPGEPERLGGILAGGRRVVPSGRSSWRLGLDD